MFAIIVLSLFSGIGAFEKALKNLNIDYELVGYSEIDKYASKSYSLIHNESESKNLGDITKIDINDLPKDIDLITYGFPCQDISVAGKKQGLIDSNGKKTRSGLFFNALNIIQAVKPKIAIAENVKNLTGKRFKNEFEVVLNSLNLAGYNNYYKVLNAKDYGIPQNRERVFIVSIRKDIDNGEFEFPKPIELTKRLKDILEDEVEEKYYLKNLTMTFINNSFRQEKNGNGFRFEPHVKNKANCAKAITTRARGRMDDNFVIDIETEQEKFKFDSTNKLLQIGTLDIKGQDIIKRVYSSNGISPTLTNMQGGNRQPKIVASRGRYVTENGQTKIRQSLELNDTGNTNALTTVQKDNYVLEPQFRIRKLTPKECFRLMGFDDEDFQKAEKVNSNTQLYKQAGNSICVPVLVFLFEKLREYGYLTT